MIEHADSRDGRYVTLINKVNEVIATVNELTKELEKARLDFDNHHHTTYKGTECEGSTGGPIITMIDERED